MKTQPITVESGQITIRPSTNGDCLTQRPIVNLFDVFTSAVMRKYPCNS